jgi:hypothetical protein
MTKSHSHAYHDEHNSDVSEVRQVDHSQMETCPTNIGTRDAGIPRIEASIVLSSMDETKYCFKASSALACHLSVYGARAHSSHHRFGCCDKFAWCEGIVEELDTRSLEPAQLYPQNVFGHLI